MSIDDEAHVSFFAVSDAAPLIKSVAGTTTPATATATEIATTATTTTTTAAATKIKNYY